MVGPKWGLGPKVVHWLYTAVVRPILTYGVLVWWPALDKNYVVKKLSRIQRAATICISGALRTTPTAALEVMLYLIPIDLYGKQIAAKAALRLRELSMLNVNNGGHSKILSSFADIPETTDYCNPTEVHLHKSFSVVIPTREDWDNGTWDYSDKIGIFTDGSKLNEQVGGGVYSKEFDTKLSFRLPDHCSVFQAEVVAIKKGLSLILNRPLSGRDVYIFSDSQAALKSLESTRHSSKTIVQCHQLLEKVSQYFNITLVWVPGHRDIEGNCVADELAREGTKMELYSHNQAIPMPIATCKLHIDRQTLSAANARWEQMATCSISRQTWPEWNLNRSKLLLRLSRQDISNTIGVLTGHCPIGRHAGRLGIPHNDYCRSCRDEEEEETVEHLLCSCVALCRKRYSTLGLASLSSLSEITKLGLTSVNSFIKAAGWLNKNQGC